MQQLESAKGSATAQLADVQQECVFTLLSFLPLVAVTAWECTAQQCRTKAHDCGIWELLWTRDFSGRDWLGGDHRPGTGVPWPQCARERCLVASRGVCVLECPKCNWRLGNWVCGCCGARLRHSSNCGSVSSVPSRITSGLCCSRGCGATRGLPYHSPCERRMQLRWALMGSQQQPGEVLLSQSTVWSFAEGCHLYGCRRCHWGVHLGLLRCFTCNYTEPLKVDLELHSASGVTALSCSCRPSGGLRRPLLSGSGAVSLECACEGGDGDMDDFSFFELNFELQ
uniref:Uncharacterized protein n=1 Tax=Pyrodinium bahamense TaxID=73915 RepID=A0A7S0AHD6_9DINO|mmetsp:Transcript_34235/g.94572  ORF Transcript_34235/g.94572 Transcript_34235/m.94572 type:complete len:283 (+) Transcript_34235:108-956(+)